MSRQRVIQYIQENNLNPVRVSRVARELGYSRQYIHEVCLKNRLTTNGKAPVRYNTCDVCNEPVYIMNKLSPYKRHNGCAARYTRPAVCAWCKRKIPGRAANENRSLSFCNREHRDEAQAAGIWRSQPTFRPVGYDAKVRID